MGNDREASFDLFDDKKTENKPVATDLSENNTSDDNINYLEKIQLLTQENQNLRDATIEMLETIATVEEFLTKVAFTRRCTAGCFDECLDEKSKSPNHSDRQFSQICE